MCVLSARVGKLVQPMLDVTPSVPISARGVSRQLPSSPRVIRTQHLSVRAGNRTRNSPAGVTRAQPHSANALNVHNARNARRNVHSGYNAREQHANRGQITTMHAPSVARATRMCVRNARVASRTQRHSANALSAHSGPNARSAPRERSQRNAPNLHNARNVRSVRSGRNAREHVRRVQITTMHAPSAARAVAVIAVNRRAAKHLVWST